MADSERDERRAPIWLLQFIALIALVYLARLELVTGKHVASHVWGILGMVIIGPDLAKRWPGMFGGHKNG